MVHLRQECGEIVEDDSAFVCGEAGPDLAGSDGHGGSPLVARRISSRIASRVSFATGELWEARPKLVAAMASLKTAPPSYATQIWRPSRDEAEEDTTAKRRPKSGCRGSVTVISPGESAESESGRRAPMCGLLRRGLGISPLSILMNHWSRSCRFTILAIHSMGDPSASSGAADVLVVLFRPRMKSNIETAAVY